MKKINQEKPPYPSARLKGMGEMMIFIQEPGWRPEKIDALLMEKLGIAKGKETLAVSTLKFLGILDKQCSPTIEFDNLKNNYQGTLKRLVEDKYSALFSIIPARLVNQARLVSFFGGTVDTAEYQAKLFVWFCKQANIDLPNVEDHFHRSRFDKKEEKQ